MRSVLERRALVPKKGEVTLVKKPEVVGLPA
jgi:hypothetical protein